MIKMNEEEKDKLFSNIESDLWELKHNVAYINKKDYYGLSRDLLDYIRKIEQENKKYKEVIDKAINNSQYWIDYYTRLNSDERIALRLQENIDILKEVK